MKQHRNNVKQFGMSPLARAGLLIKNLQNGKNSADHDHNMPHRDDHYLLSLSTHGQMKFNHEFEEISIVEPSLLMVLPGQVHYIIEAKEMQGWIISFDPALISKELQVIIEKGFKKPLPLNHHPSLFEQAVLCMELMEKLQAGVPDVFTGKSLQSLLDALLSLIAGLFITLDLSQPLAKSRGSIIEHEFSELVKLMFKTQKQPAWYADKLGISVAHLYDTVKLITGVSASAYIQQYCMVEAKRLLYFSSLTVKEIGYELGYAEPVYFGKLFKKITGLSPLQFRKQYHD